MSYTDTLPSEKFHNNVFALFCFFAVLSLIGGVILAIIFWPIYSYSIAFILAGILQAAIYLAIVLGLSYLRIISQNTNSIINKEYSSYVPVGMKECPFCEEFIKKRASKCPYCTSEIPVKEKEVANRKSSVFISADSEKPIVREHVICCRNCGMAHSIKKKGEVCDCGLLLK